jgi:DNA invertase Pin-like site-specific DNA recombinase
MFLRVYLRASTKEQDANRAKDDLITFAKERNLKIAAFYVENESGASLERFFGFFQIVNRAISFSLSR